MTVRIAALVRVRAGSPPPPEESPHGRAALRLLEEGIEVIFGDRGARGRLSGFAARRSKWVPVESASIAAAYDRYPLGGRPDAHRELCRSLEGVPIANPPPLARLCRDKLAAQRHLAAQGVPMPPVETDRALFAERLAAWGGAYLKPRCGSFGRGVCYLAPGDRIPESAERDPDGPRFLQGAVAPPPGLDALGLCVRVLAQRAAEGAWLLDVPVAITSRTDRVASAERGARAAPAEELLSAGALRRVKALSERVCAALEAGPAREGEADRLVELGIDLAVGAGEQAWVLEVNAQPRGRLERLAAREPARYRAAHLESCCRPLRYLASRFAG